MTKNVYRLRIELVDTEPLVWRRVLVPGGLSLDRLHDVIQAAMGWQDCHLHCFEIAGARYEPPDPWGEDFERAQDERAVILGQVAPHAPCEFEYVYDFGDNWTHEITVEEISPPDAATPLPRCLEGERACPPEDCGGPWGYPDLLEILGNPDHPEYTEMRDWAGPDFDPAAFHLARVNRRLRRKR